MPIPTTDVTQMTAIAMVIRFRLRSAIDDPPKLLDMPPPNMSERPPPRPLCIKIKSTKKSPLKTSRTSRKIRTPSTPLHHHQNCSLPLST